MTQIVRLRWKVTNHVFNQSLLPSTWTVDSWEVFISFFYKILNWIQSNYADSHGSLVTFLTNHCLFSMYNWKKFVCNTYIKLVTNNIQLFFFHPVKFYNESSLGIQLYAVIKTNVSLFTHFGYYNPSATAFSICFHMSALQLIFFSFHHFDCCLIF